MSRKTPNSKRTALLQTIRTFLVEEEGIAGSALVEFTLLAPMLVIMSIYTMDYGLLVYNKLELQNAAQAGAQWAMANRVYNSSLIQTAAQNATKLPASNFNITSSQFCGCSENSGGSPIVTQLSLGACTASSTCTQGVAGTYVSVTATPTTTYHSFIRYGLVPSTYSLTASSTARIQ
jgi:Flp pilus assembly protein TadG